MDFITNLTVSQYFDSIFVVVDGLTKMAYFIHFLMAILGEETAKLFLNNIYWHHGLPNNIISDQSPQFISKFWKSLF